MLIGLRVLQAAGGAAFMPAASGIVMDVFGEHRQRALGLFSSIFPLGALVGPIVGGIILTTGAGEGCSWSTCPSAAFTMLAWRFLPSSAGHGGRPDVVGALLMGGGVLGLMLAITDAGSRTVGLTSPSFLVPFVLRGLRLGIRAPLRPGRNPVIPFQLLRGRVFAATNAINVVWGACAIGFGSLVPLFAEDRYGLTPLSSGTLLTARAIGEIMLAMFAAVLIHRTGYRVPIIVGIALIAGGLAMIATRSELYRRTYGSRSGPALPGLAPVCRLQRPITPLSSCARRCRSHHGAAGTARQGGAIIGIAIATSVAAHTGHEVQSLTNAFFVLAALLVCMVPLVFLVPDGRRHTGPQKAAALTPQPSPA